MRDGANGVAVSAGPTSQSFSFTGLVNGTYAIVVQTPPAGQTCTTSQNVLVSSANASVSITCTTSTTPTYSVGSSISGHTGNVVIQNNNGSNQTIASGTSTFSFTGLANNANYAVTVLTPPAGQTCSVTNGTGAISSANVTNVSITCTTTPTTYSVGGSISGHTGNVGILNNGAGLQTIGTGTSTYSFTGLASGSNYSITISSHPAGQTCTVSNGTDFGLASNVTNANITCTTNITKILMYAGDTSSGQIDATFTNQSRNLANDKCFNNKPVACTTGRMAVISVPTVAGNADSVDGSGFVPNLTIPIRNATDTMTIANNWTNLLAGTFVNSISAAGVTASPYWTGSGAGGTLSNTCGGGQGIGDGWTSNTNGDGQVGNPAATDGTWLDNGTAPCNTVKTILCVCW